MTIPIIYCLALGSAISDILKNKILNEWLLLGCMAKIILLLTGTGMHEMIYMPVVRACMTLMLLFPIYYIRGIGGGDVKLFAVLSLFLSSGELFSSVMMTFFIAAIFGIVKLFIIKKLPCKVHLAIPIMISIMLVTGSGGLICS